ncbi:Peptidyl-prolyl cis-trans isomerase fpr2 [Arachnomyces sp. PD_36]|nr:Peptidyl-prolyl cis-trans isomerase fpr2 [Arachnomyces sp. PD_36]
MRLSILTSLLALSLSVLAADESASSAPEVQIEYLEKVEDCERRTETGDSIRVHYRGTLAADGSPFDNSYDRKTPLKFELGAGRVIKGWEDGLLDMCVGEKRKLTIPPELAYGEKGIGPIPGGATLIFETELVGFGVDKKKPEKKEDDTEKKDDKAEL